MKEGTVGDPKLPNRQQCLNARCFSVMVVASFSVNPCVVCPSITTRREESYSTTVSSWIDKRVGEDAPKTDSVAASL